MNGKMQKVIFVIFLILTSTNNLFCQNSEWKITPKIGISYNSVYDPSAWEYKLSPLLVGIESSKSISDRIALSGELSFVRKGPHSKEINSVREHDYIFDFMILSTQLNFIAFENLKIETAFGPYAGYLLNSEQKVHPEEDFSNYESGSKKVDFGLNLSVRKFIPLNNFEFVIEPRFQLGLIQVSYSKQISFQLLMGVRF
jgi:hypothetical protein